ncbi:MAG TPA: PAS-domain containing protein, partial [Gemmataceae bacterium]|nr:PAS-domain containing protein [Gemmataceae bacterium]
MRALAINVQRRLGAALAIGLGCLAVAGAAATFIFGEIGADWLRLSLVAQVVVVAGLGTVLVWQIAALRRTQGSLVTANSDLAGAQASLETSNRILRATQKELQRTRQQLIDGIEGLSDGFALYDGEDRLVVCNSRYRQLFGLHPDLLRPGTPFVDILRAHVSAGRVAAAIGSEDEWVAERLAQHRDPRGLFERKIDGHWFRFSDRPTSEGGVVTIFTQIDELKQREQRLRENQAILQSILDNIPVTVSITDRERRIVLLNRRLEDIYGVHLAEVVGRNVEEVRPIRYSSDTAARDHLRVIETGEPILGRQDDYVHGRDSESWITNVAPIKDADGAVRYVLRTTFEVPQLAKANRELADYRAFLLEAERQAKIASWHQIPEGGYRTVWSENVEAVVGYTNAEIDDDAAFLAVIHPADRERMQRLFNEVNSRPQSYDTEYRVVRKDGRTIWVRGITKGEFDRAGDLIPLSICRAPRSCDRPFSQPGTRYRRIA